ncbi:chorismate lyase [Laribacter hongkongensis]|uniref:chorismate--pyruvate lyase family protein n=1 Tax=Laribacter hongkongensis TaxID=168471 RepID=UPI001EFDD6D6|nr:chorismate lyase [Laribacter hongkongensis]MCG8991612.1 chorismate lyase [Laribacter hongkongensis]MCG8996880.1 chorismate lyase [Laribacter hongkongensis]MCG9002705.1 chorismate lyase [Laribacter hongkongensis]MCG9004956.1 chorismate lyase [Laribacter hongkongensis]MCG9008598.1 chorismate lyase [Laribacter hongkongensis]
MNSLPDWLAAPPANHPVLPLLAHDGSLTDRLKASGLPFSVEVAAWYTGPARADEARTLAVAAGSTLWIREVWLRLAERRVVWARSVSASERWLPVLDRGGVSLGLTLFGGDPAIARSPLEFAAVTPCMALHPGAGYPSLWARRACFVLEGAPMLVHEVFLPDCEIALP